MIEIALFCSAGMSTSMLVKKMRIAAEKRGIETHIEAYPVSSLSKKVEEGIDVALLGPQVRFKLNTAKAICDPKGVSIEVIDSKFYGMMDGDKVLDSALKLIEK